MKLVAKSMLLLAAFALGVFAAGKAEIADALMRGDKLAARQAIEAKADVYATQNDGATALHWAVFQGDREMVDLLLKAGANPKTSNRNGATPMWLAAVNGDAAILEMLIKAGASADERLPQGRTPLMAAARTGKVDALKVLIDWGASVNAKEDLRGTTPIMWAADEGHADAIKYLIKRGADFKATSAIAERGRGPALGKANDPRRQVAAQGAALAAGRALDLGDLAAIRGDTNGPAGAAGAAGGNNRARAGAAAGAAGAGAGANRRAGFGAGANANADAVANPNNDFDDNAAAAVGLFQRRAAPMDGGKLTPLIYAVRANNVEAVKALLEAGADINQTSGYGWSPLLTATQNRYYQLGKFLIEHGADVNLVNKGGWTPLYLATDNRNIENGDYPVRRGDMDHLDFIKLLVEKGADVNARIKDSTQTRTVFTNQWLDEDGATAFLRASQSGDVVLMKYLLSKGADPKIATKLNVTPLHVAAGNGWVEGITYEWSEAATDEAVKMLLELGVDPNIQADTGRTALHGAAHKGRVKVIQMLVDAGAKLDTRDYGNTDNRGGKLAVHTWQAVDYADGLVRVGVQSAIPHPEAGHLLRELMKAKGMPYPPEGRTLESICITEACE